MRHGESFRTVLELFLGKIRGSDELAHPRPELRLDGGHGQPATVFRLIQTVEGKRPGQKGLACDRLFAGGKETREAEDHERHGGIVDRDVDELPAARTVSHPQRGQDRKGGVEAAREIGDRDPGDRGGLVLPPRCHAEDPSEGLEVDVVSGEILVRPRLTVSREGAIDEPRVHHGEIVVGHSEPRHHAGTKLFDDHVGTAREFVHDLLTFGCLQVHGERPLSSIHHEERIGDVVHDGGNGAHVVAQFRVFDLDHLRAEVAQELRTERTWQEPREVQHGDSRKGRRHVRWQPAVAVSRFARAG